VAGNGGCSGQFFFKLLHIRKNPGYRQISLWERLAAAKFNERGGNSFPQSIFSLLFLNNREVENQTLSKLSDI
jgi:hypothetical protein